MIRSAADHDTYNDNPEWRYIPGAIGNCETADAVGELLHQAGIKATKSDPASPEVTNLLLAALTHAVMDASSNLSAISSELYTLHPDHEIDRTGTGR